MYDIAALFEIVAVIAVVAAPPIILARLLAGRDVDTQVRLFAVQRDLPWPRGVQEEDPPRWRVEIIDASRRHAAPSGRCG
jgi:hypothetical protein